MTNVVFETANFLSPVRTDWSGGKNLLYNVGIYIYIVRLIFDIPAQE